MNTSLIVLIAAAAGMVAIYLAFRLGMSRLFPRETK
jgi:hypothetical protein